MREENSQFRSSSEVLMKSFFFYPAIFLGSLLPRIEDLEDRLPIRRAPQLQVELDI